jgi:hypothetical protein
MGEQTLVRQAVNMGFIKMVDMACDRVAEKVNDEGRVSEKDKRTVKGLMCDNLIFVAETIAKKEASLPELGIYLINTGLNITKLTGPQQAYCIALRAEMALSLGQLATEAATTYAATVPATTAGIVAGGIYGSVYPVVGTTAGMVVGGSAAAAGPLALGSAAMYSTVSKLTDAALDYHSQCGPLVFDKVEPWRNPGSTPMTAWCGPDTAGDASKGAS